MSDREFFNEFVEKKTNKKNYFLIAISAVVIIGFISLAWLAYDVYNMEEEVVDAPIIMEEETETKVRPEDPGGMEIPNLDKTIYESLEQGSKNDVKVKIAENPEEPINKDAIAENAKESQEAIIIKEEEPIREAKNDIKDEPKIAKAPAVEAEIEEPKTSQIAKPQEETKVAQEAPKQEEVAKDTTTPAQNEIKEEVVTEQPKEEKKVQIQKVEKETGRLNKMKEKSGLNNGSSIYKIQVGSVRSESDAASEWNRAKAKNSSILSKYDYTVERADLGPKGIFYRIQTGSFNSYAEANAVCKKLIARNQGCIVVKNK